MMIAEVLTMWKRFLSTSFVFLALITAANAQESIRTAVLSANFSNIPGTPRVVNNEPGRFWVVVWRQNSSPASINCRIMQSDGRLGSIRTLVNSVSTAVRSFDLTYLRQSGNYVLAYELQDGLHVQSFNGNFVRQGAVVAIQKGVHETQPRFLISSSSKRLFLFWLAGQDISGHKIIRRVELEPNGSMSGAIQNLITAQTSTAFESFSVAENPKNGIQFAIINQSAQSGGTKILGTGFHLDGTRANQVPFVLQQFATKINSHPDVSFSPIGQGLGGWHAGGQIRYRFLSSQGNPSAPAKSFSNAGDVNSNPVTTFDSKKEVFVEAWTKATGVFASAIDPIYATQEIEFKSIASAPGMALNPDLSFDRATGKSLLAWEEQTGNTFRIHATLFQIHSEEFAVQGTVVLRKEYKPPIQLNGKKYLYKFHVRSGGKLYRAYVTPESEIVGSLPKEGNQIHMIYEPFRGKYRGYVESIQVIN
jgi:hypothetical protein